MLTIRVAALSLLVIALATALTTGDEAPGRPPRFPPRWLRIVFPLPVAVGLWLTAPWAWWAALILTAFLAVIGTGAVLMFLAGGMLRRPAEHRLLITAVIESLIPLGTLILLVLPPSRAALP